ncbi:protein phosphatase 2C [Achlya hypogyna]|uniref:Protein phosphatase 2C n=1 Tax=Achlya hypogyna TaxID=1202772 RepID=A0A1V9ZRG2_ACHHY|nr:protein phosphatase 2C [Achlya hypogyna]
MGCTPSSSSAKATDMTPAHPDVYEPARPRRASRSPLSCNPANLPESDDPELQQFYNALKVRDHTPHVSVIPTSHASVKRPMTHVPKKHRDVMSIFGDAGMALDVTPTTSVHSTPTSSSSMLLSPSLMHGDMLDSSRDTVHETLNVAYGSATLKGQRAVNEDRHTATTETINDRPIGFFGVYDGHGGTKVSDFLAEHLHVTFFNHLSQRPQPSLYKQLEEAMLFTDNLIYERNIEHGSTAICLAVTRTDMAVASLGDSQAILCTNDGRAVDLCLSHRPAEASETARIVEAKGTVVNGRIFGVLGVSRAFGDNDFKTSKGAFKDKFNGDLVGGRPHVIQRHLSPTDEFIVLGCDGLFDVMTPDELVTYVRPRLALQGVQKTCEDLLQHALRLGSTDNVSAVIVKFHP